MGRREVVVAPPVEEAEKMKKNKSIKKVDNENNTDTVVVEVKDQKKKKTQRKLKRSQRDARELLHQSEFSDEEIQLVKPERNGAESPDAEVHDARVSANDTEYASDEGPPAVDESDSSEDEVAPRNTIGDVPLEWYKDEEHIGYDITGKKIKKKEGKDKLEKFLASADDSKDWRKIYDEPNDEEVELTREETKLIRHILQGKAPHSDFDPHEPYVDFFKYEDAIHPLSNAPEPKRRFIPSKWESKKVIRMVRAIREGRIKLEKPEEEESRSYDLWGDESRISAKTRGPYVPPPKQKAPDHAESYNPSREYIPFEEEIKSDQMIYDEDRPKFIPKSHSSLRSVPAYYNAVKESMDRCLDIYMCPRVHRKKLNVSPDVLKPILPDLKNFKPYPTVCELEFKGHKGAVVSISVDPSGQWIASGSTDGTVRVWNTSNCRCTRVWDLGEVVQHVAWNPLKQLPVLAVAVGSDVLILDTGVGNEEEKSKIAELLCAESPSVSSDTASIVNWLRDDKHGGVRLSHMKTVSSIEWHRGGDYFSTVSPTGETRSSVLLHQLSKKLTDRNRFNLHGLPVSSAFHPTRSYLLVATKRNIRIYDLLKSKLHKKLQTGFREVSSMAVHPRGDNIIVGSRDGKLCWFDMDYSHPYKTYRCYKKDITNVAFHRSYPLFASSSDDCTSHVFHGMVSQDLTKDTNVVLLRILRGHSSSNGRGVLDCKFHPTQPWLFTAGADGVIRLYCHE